MKIRVNRSGRTVIQEGHSIRIYWNPSMVSYMKENFATTKNEDLAISLGVSPRTVTRKAREMGLQKDPDWVHQLWVENTKIAHAVNRIHPNAGIRNLSMFGKKTRFKQGHEHIKLTDEQMARMQRRRVATLKENIRRGKKGLPKLSQREREDWWRMLGI